jgi:hypothetical protein
MEDVRCLPLIKRGRKLVFLSFTNVDPQALTQNFLLDVVNNLWRNEMHDLNDTTKKPYYLDLST